MIALNDLEFSNRKFWIGFTASAFPTALDEETDMTLTELIDKNKAADIVWWNDFTKYYDGVFEEADGYVDEPETLVCRLTSVQTLKIEFHPGDIVYYINDKQIACTGPEYKIHIFPWAELLKYAEGRSDNRLFLLLLPLAVIRREDAKDAAKIISDILSEIFDRQLCSQFAVSIVHGLLDLDGDYGFQ